LYISLQKALQLHENSNEGYITFVPKFFLKKLNSMASLENKKPVNIKVYGLSPKKKQSVWGKNNKMGKPISCSGSFYTINFRFIIRFVDHFPLLLLTS